MRQLQRNVSDACLDWQMEAAPCRLVLIEHLCPEYFASENLLAGVPAVLHKCDVRPGRECKGVDEARAERGETKD